jgi:hypothetical protein
MSQPVDRAEALRVAQKASNKKANNLLTWVDVLFVRIVDVEEKSQVWPQQQGLQCSRNWRC